MLRTLLASLLLVTCGVLSSTAQTTDPFALLFGQEDQSIDAGSERAPGRDDVELVRVKLGQFVLLDSQAAFQTEAGLCLPVEALLKALEAPIEVTGDSAKGWFIHPDRSIALDFAAGQAMVRNQPITLSAQMTEEGWCVPLADWSKLLPIDFEYRAATLSVKLTPTEILPIEARLERAALRKLIRPDRNAKPDYPLIEEPYQWLSFPTADVSIETVLTSSQGVSTTGSVELAGDLLKMTGRLQYGGTGRPRMTLGRSSEAAEQLGVLKARSFAMGDVVSAQLPLLTKGGTVLGLTVSNRPTVSADVFDVTDIRGPLPRGWEAELYDGEQLLSFVTEPDVKGDYVFPDVALQPGYNRLTVKLFGPYGEREDRVVKIMVGAELCPENELQYSFGLVATDADEGVSEATSGSPAAYASLRYGLSEKATLQLDGIVSDTNGPMGASASLSGSAFETYGVLRVASDGQGSPAFAASLQKRLNERGSRVRLDVHDFGSMETQVNGFGDARTQRSALLTYDTDLELGIGRGSNALRTSMAWKQLVDGSEEAHLSARLAGTYGGARWSHALRYSNTKTPEGASQSDLLGDVLVSKSFKGVRVRGAVSYSATDAFEIKTLSLAAQKRFGKASFGQVALSRDMSTDAYNLTASYSKEFDRFVLSTNAGADNTGAFNAGVRLSFSLFNDRMLGRYAMARPGLSRTGAVRVTVFDDLDETGDLSLSDTTLSGAGFIVDQSLRREQTDSRGSVLIGDIQPGSPANVELKQSTIEDPFLRPERSGVAVIVRPGRVVDVAFPLTATGDVDGTVTMQVGEYKTPVSGVLVEAVDADGRVIAATKSEYDGYFYIDNIPARPFTLRVGEEALSAVNADMEAVPVKLSREEPSVSGLNLTITGG